MSNLKLYRPYLIAVLLIIVMVSCLSFNGCKVKETTETVQEISEEVDSSQETSTEEETTAEEGDFNTCYLPEVFGEDSVIGGDNQAVVGPIGTLAAGALDKPDYCVSSYISWDITSLQGKEVRHAELIFDSNMVYKDPFAVVPMSIMTVDWGEKQFTPGITCNEGELVATSDKADFVISDGKLLEEIQKSIIGGKSRFQVKMFFDYPEDVDIHKAKEDEDLGYLNYRLGYIRLNVSAEGIETAREERPAHMYLADGVTGISYLSRPFVQTPFGIDIGPDGYIYMADSNGKHIVTLSPDGEIGDMGIWKDPNIWQSFWNYIYPWSVWNNSKPLDVAFDAAGNLYITDGAGVYKVKEDCSLEVLPGIQTPVHELAFSPSGELYYAHYKNFWEADGKIYKINNVGDLELVVEGLTFCFTLTIGQDGTIFTNNDDKVVRIDPETYEVREFYSRSVIEGGPRAVDAQGDIWVSGWIDNNFRVVQLSPDGEEKPFYINGKDGSDCYFKAEGIAIDSDGTQYWAGGMSSSVWKLVPTGQGDDDFRLEVISDYIGFVLDCLEASPDGNVYTINNRNQNELLCFAHDGNYKTILDCNEKDLPLLRHLAIDSKGTIYVNFIDGELSILETDGSLGHFASVSAAQMCCGFDDKIYALTDENQPKIVCIDGQDSVRTIIGNINGIKGCSLKEIRIAASPNGGIFVYNQSNADLYYITPEGREEFYINLKFCNLNTGGNVWPWEIAVTEEGEIYAHSWDLYRIDKEKNVYIHAFGTTDNNAIEISPDGNWLYIGESGLLMVPIDAESKKTDKRVWGKWFLPLEIETEGGIIVLSKQSDSWEGYRSADLEPGYAAGEYPVCSVRCFYSFDIEDLKNKNIKHAEFQLNTSSVVGDPFSYGPLCVKAVDWGERNLTLEDYDIDGEEIAEVHEQNFKIDNDKLTDAIKKAIDEKKSRLRLMLYFDVGESGISGDNQANYGGSIGARLLIYYTDK